MKNQIIFRHSAKFTSKLIENSHINKLYCSFFNYDFSKNLIFSLMLKLYFFVGHMRKVASSEIWIDGDNNLKIRDRCVA